MRKSYSPAGTTALSRHPTEIAQPCIAPFCRSRQEETWNSGCTSVECEREDRNCQGFGIEVLVAELTSNWLRSRTRFMPSLSLQMLNTAGILSIGDKWCHSPTQDLPNERSRGSSHLAPSVPSGPATLAGEMRFLNQQA